MFSVLNLRRENRALNEMRPEQKRNLKNNETYEMTKLIKLTKVLTKLEKIKNFLETGVMHQFDLLSVH